MPMVQSMGRLWTLAEVGPRIRRDFSAWCRTRARQLLYDDKLITPPAAFRDMVAVLNEEVAAGSYTWGAPTEENAFGSGALAMFKSPEGEVAFLRMLLQAADAKGQERVDDEQVAAIILDCRNGPDGGAALRDAVNEALGPNASPPTPAENGVGKQETPTNGATTPACATPTS